MTDTTETPIPPVPSTPVMAAMVQVGTAAKTWIDSAFAWARYFRGWFLSFAVWVRLSIVGAGCLVAGALYPSTVLHYVPSWIIAKADAPDATAARVETVLSQIQLLSQKIDGIGRLAFEANTKLDGLPAQYAANPSPAPAAALVQPIPRRLQSKPAALPKAQPIAPDPSMLEKLGNMFKTGEAK